MKKQYLALSLLTPVLCPALTAEARTPKENKVTNREQPNVIVILADDLGYGAEPVGYHHDCSSLIELIQILDYGAFVLGIQGIGGFVQKDI